MRPPTPQHDKVAWWKVQLESEMAAKQAAGSGRHGGRRRRGRRGGRRRHRDSSSSSSYESDDGAAGAPLSQAQLAEMEALRGQLQDARRMIEESQRHEKVLRRALRRAERDVIEAVSPVGARAGLLAQLAQPPPLLPQQQQPPPPQWLPLPAVLAPPPPLPAAPADMRVPHPPPPRPPGFGGAPERVGLGPGADADAFLAGGGGGVGSGVGLGGLGAAPAEASLERVLDALSDELCAEAAQQQLGGVVKDAVREVVAGMLPRRPQRAAHEKPVYVELLGAVMSEALAEEGAAVVSEALAELAQDYVGRRAAEREMALLLGEVLGDDLPRVAAEARVEAATAALIDEVVGELAASAAQAAMREARGAAAKSREAHERALVSEVAADAMLEELLLERLLQQLAARGEGALLQRAAGQMLDEMLADAMCRHAMRLARRQSSVRDSLVLGSVHRQLANRAMLEEMLAQLQQLSASGLEAVGAGDQPPEETDSEGDDEVG